MGTIGDLTPIARIGELLKINGAKVSLFVHKDLAQKFPQFDIIE